MIVTKKEIRMVEMKIKRKDNMFKMFLKWNSNPIIYLFLHIKYIFVYGKMSTQMQGTPYNCWKRHKKTKLSYCELYPQ